MKPSLLLVVVALAACHHGAAAPATIGSETDEASEPVGPAPGPIYVAVADPKTDEPGAARLLPALGTTILRLLDEDGVETTWLGGGAPTREQLDEAGTKGASITATITSLTSAPSTAQHTAVTCKVSLMLTSFPELSMFGMIDGGASVEATTDPADIAAAEQDCIDAVVQDLVVKKALPAIREH